MKIMSCKQLGGACDKEFQANSFEEIAEMSKQHGKYLSRIILTILRRVFYHLQGAQMGA